MDAYNPAVDLKYADLESELGDHGIEDTWKLFTLSLEHLATFGCLGRSGAESLHRYARDSVLGPLGLLDSETGGNAEAVVKIDSEEEGVAVEKVAKEEDPIDLVTESGDSVELIAENILEDSVELVAGNKDSIESFTDDAVSEMVEASDEPGEEAVLQWREGVSGRASDVEAEEVGEPYDDDFEREVAVSVVSSHEV